MFANSNSRNVFQRATCMLLSILVVGASLGIGMLAANHAATQQHYSVTITQLL